MEKKPRDNGPLLPGIVLIVVGLAFLLSQYNVITSDQVWPMFILAPGFGFLALYITSSNKRASSGLIIPGVITVLLGLFFFYLNFTSWNQMEFLWPIFPLIVGVSFYLYFLGNGREKSERGILIPATILTAVGIIFLALAGFSYKLWPIVLIAMGALMLFTGRRTQKNNEAAKKEQEIDQKDE